MDESETMPNFHMDSLWHSPPQHHEQGTQNSHLMVATLQIHEHDNLTAKFLKRDGNSRSVLGDHWKDKRVSIRAKRRLLQSIRFQFPCAENFKKWGWQESDECRLCKSLYPEQSVFSECLGHIQGYCYPWPCRSQG